MKRQPTECEKIFANYISNKGLTLKSLGMTITKYQKEKTNKQTTTTTPQPS
jgi:hypothetical protein